MEQPRTFRIDRGIGHYDFNDYYAILGLPLTAEASHVRKRYLTIAKCLHPDIYGRTPAEKQVATQYLSKLVNPAYDVLSQERERTEYSAILKLLGKRLMKRNQKFTPQSEIAQKYLVSARFNNYEQTIQEIAKVQYQNLNQALENIGLLSELNLVHILIAEGYKHSADESASFGMAVPKNAVVNAFNSNNTSVQNNDTRVSSSNSSNSSNSYQMRSDTQIPQRNYSSNTSVNASDTKTNGTENKSSSSFNSNYKSSLTGEANFNKSNNSQQADRNADRNVNYNLLDQYILEAEKMIAKQSWGLALKELRSAVQLDCNSSKCHALLGFVYMHQKLAGMAKVSFQQALKLNPEEPLALQYINQVGGVSPNVDSAQDKSKDDKKGGFFGWLGGG